MLINIFAINHLSLRTKFILTNLPVSLPNLRNSRVSLPICIYFHKFDDSSNNRLEDLYKKIKRYFCDFLTISLHGYPFEGIYYGTSYSRGTLYRCTYVAALDDGRNNYYYSNRVFHVL